MPTYLSPTWMARADELLAAAPGLAVDGDDVLVIEQRITTATDEVRYHLRFDGDGARIIEGSAEQAAVVFSLDHTTATAIARGEASAQVAFQSGSLRVSGDMQRLVRHRQLVDSADDVLGPLRADTTYEAADA